MGRILSTVFHLFCHNISLANCSSDHNVVTQFLCPLKAVRQGSRVFVAFIQSASR